jgi:hypothetical protein
VLAFPGISRVFPADAALGLSVRIIGENNVISQEFFGLWKQAKERATNLR